MLLQQDLESLNIELIDDELILKQLAAKAGVSEAEILETVQIVAIFNATNRLNAGLGVKVDGGAFDAFRG